MHNNLFAIRSNFNTCLRIIFSAGNKRFSCSICFLFSFYFLLFEIVLYQPHHFIKRSLEDGNKILKCIPFQTSNYTLRTLFPDALCITRSLGVLRFDAAVKHYLMGSIHILRRYNNVQFIKSIEHSFFITLIYSQKSCYFNKPAILL